MRGSRGIDLLRTSAIALVLAGAPAIAQSAIATADAPVVMSVDTTTPEAQPPAKKRFWPGRAAWRQAALNAVKDPGTWGPASATLVVAAVPGWDGKISDWASSNTPVFGSVSNAATWSDRLRAASDLGMIATALSVHADEHPWRLRVKTLLVEEAGAITATSLTALLKNATDRERPDGSDRESFPSGHTSRAFAYAAASRRNLEATQLARGWQIGLTAGFETLAIGTGWARIEAQKHYPSDVLAGAALGNYVALFLHDAFLGTAGDVSATVNLDPRSPSFTVRIMF
jgi:membrane-associated phospholipid phosphatase